jgi:hypothetical protein
MKRDWWHGLWMGALLLLIFELIFWILLVSTPFQIGHWTEWRHYLIDHLERPNHGDVGGVQQTTRTACGLRVRC